MTQYGDNASASASVGNDPDLRMIDIGGRRLAMTCTGAGSPAVILETGLGAESRDWAAVQDSISTVTRVVRYDRANRGASDPAPGPRTALDMVADLRRMLRAAEIDGPYLLVGHSFGGLIVRVYAQRHGDEVAGVVLADSMHRDQFDVFSPLFPPPSPAEPPVLGRIRAFWQGGWRSPDSTPEKIDLVASIRQDREVTSLGDVPLHVVAAGATMRQLAPAGIGDALQEKWQSLQMDFLKLSTRAVHLLAPQSGHFVQRDAPQAVGDAIRAVIALTRQS